ncbi:acyltransferase family protein [Lelliottia aquatilis]|uniref:acyltransferase family protein n=1 Tax=Lelliottia aquatilis TaxID=2080838 RepID=UPI0013FE4975|nr:acyltransferase [Lelliottia aquatilis]
MLVFSQNVVTIWMVIATLCIILLFNTRFFAFLDAEHLGREINKELIGLRFFLALGVVFHHYIFSYKFSLSGLWESRGFEFNCFLGPFGVGLFFVISGYLFYSVINSDTNWPKLFVNRFFRIAPLCLVSSLVCVIIAIGMGGWHISDENARDIIYWFDSGVYNYRPDISSYKGADLINAGVTWTLYWEWLFYFSLPLLSLLVIKGGKLPLVISLLLISYYVFPYFNYNYAIYSALFSFGFLARDLSLKIKSKIILNFGPIALFAGLLWALGYHVVGNKFLTLPALPFMTLFFIILINENSLFGLLRNKGVVRLGGISYSIYLLHGIVWFSLNHLVDTKSVGVITYLMQSTLALVLIMLISVLTYKYIEIPFNHLGRMIRDKM